MGPGTYRTIVADRVATLETALRAILDWVRDGVGTESDAAEKMDAALAASEEASA